MSKIQNYRPGSTLIIAVMLFYVWSFQVSAGPPVVTASVALGENIRGQDLSDDQLSAALAIDWSGGSGLFSGTSCFGSTASTDNSLANGCNAYFGYFTAIAAQQALAVQIQRFNFANGAGSRHDYTEASLDFHVRKNATLSLSTSDDWLGRGFRSIAVDASYNYSLTALLSVDLGVGLMSLEESAPVDNIPLASLGLQYEQKRWHVGVTMMFTDREKLSRMTGFDVDRPEVNVAIQYRIY